MADFRLEPAVAHCRHSRYFLIPGELGAKSIAVVGECRGCEYKGGCCCEQKFLHTCLLPFQGLVLDAGKVRGSEARASGPHAPPRNVNRLSTTRIPGA